MDHRAKSLEVLTEDASSRIKDKIKDKDKVKDKDIKKVSKRYNFNSLSLSSKNSYNSNSTRLKKVRMKALYLASKLNNQDDLAFYLKCAWNLDEQFIDDLLEISLKKEKKINYFAKSASLEMQLRAAADN